MLKRLLCLFLIVCTPHLFAIQTPASPSAIPYDPAIKSIHKTNAQWKVILTPQQYRILRLAGTEPAYTGKYDDFYKVGVYICAACGNPLFSSETKYNSRTGWPSFWEPLNKESIATKDDHYLLFIKRVEVHCRRCEGHLGHVFSDGPAPTGLRYCINSAALGFLPGKSSDF